MQCTLYNLSSLRYIDHSVNVIHRGVYFIMPMYQNKRHILTEKNNIAIIRILHTHDTHLLPVLHPNFNSFQLLLIELFAIKRRPPLTSCWPLNNMSFTNYMFQSINC